jgi:hypothetical protein
MISVIHNLSYRYMPTLLEKALKVESSARRGVKITDEEIELAIAWMQDKIGFKQIRGVLGKTNILVKMAYYLREGYRDGVLKIVDTKK